MTRPLLLSLALAALAACSERRPVSPAESPVLPAPALDLVSEEGQSDATLSGPRSAVFAGGCFWCTEAVFERLAGVHTVVSGYAGGNASTAHYPLVSSGRTDHAEAIQISYDPNAIGYGLLLEVFFSVAHDPTQLNYQGPDHGTQYRSAVFYADEEERATVAAYIEQLEAAEAWPAPIATTLEPLVEFFPAEDYHQDFVLENPTHPYVLRHSIPKVEALSARFADDLK